MTIGRYIVAFFGIATIILAWGAMSWVLEDQRHQHSLRERACSQVVLQCAGSGWDELKKR